MVWAPLVDHAVMADAIDIAPVQSAINRPESLLGNYFESCFCKGRSSYRRYIRGQRHTMLNDSDVSSTRHARALSAAHLQDFWDVRIYSFLGS